MNNHFKNLFFVIILSLPLSANAQGDSAKSRKFSVEIVGAAFTDSKRWFYYNGNDNIYSEIRLKYRINNIIQTGVFVGHQMKSYIYFKIEPFGENPLFMERQYFPAGIFGRVNITDVFYEKLRWIKNKEKWEVYVQTFLARMNGYDVRDDKDDGENIFYKFPYVIPYGKIYSGLLAGLKYHPSKNLGFFIEAGDGAMMTSQIGLELNF